MRGRCQLNKPDTKSKVRKQAWERDRDHLAFVRQLPCAACGSEGWSEAAHVRNGTDGATARKPSDKWTAPLCNGGYYSGVMPIWCHIKQHAVGEDSFWAEVGKDPLPLCEALWSLSRKYEGDELIERGRYAVQEWRRR